MRKLIIGVAFLTLVLPRLSQADGLAKQGQRINSNSPLAFIRSYAENSRFGADKSTHVSVAKVPGVMFYVAFLQGNTWCGSGGCTLLLLKSTGSSYVLAGKVSAASAPIVFFGMKDGGFPEIGVRVQGGGIQRGYEVALTPKGGKYPNSPPVLRRRVQTGRGTMLIGRDDRGVALFE